MKISNTPAQSSAVLGLAEQSTGVVATKADDQLLEALTARMEESTRLRNLSDFELIRETIKDSVADDLRVEELMDRIYPEWFNEPEPPEMPKAPRYVSVALRLGVAHEVVAFSECHCGERIATANTVADDEEYRPCFWCAIRSALYRATKQSMYCDEPEAT